MIDFCIITVTYNNSAYIQYFIDSIKKSSENISFHLFISDNNSNDLDVIKSVCALEKNVSIIESIENFGFCKGNNIAVQQAIKLNPRYILFINPDLFLTENWLDKASNIFDFDSSIGVLSGPLMHFDFASRKASGFIDSLGIDVTKYGKWFDVDQGHPISNLVDVLPEAICGALMMIDIKIINKLLNSDGYIFNESFFMYKEDIDLSLRIKKLGYRLLVHHDLFAYHCRGWDKSRNTMPFLPKKLSAINDVRVALKHRLSNLPFAILKLVYIFCFEYPLYKLNLKMM